jgi:isoprenylcysteine carboxyl methyltransferase (ICMT) family protein YpbQ
VVLEIAVVPMALGLWAFALIFTLANLALLSYRIQVENRALAWASQGGQEPPATLANAGSKG